MECHPTRVGAASLLIPLHELMREFGVQPGPVLHVGAHIGEEAVAYNQLGFTPVWWIEANIDVIPQLMRNIARYRNHHIVSALLSDSEKELTFHLASNGQSSSYLELGTHATQHPEVSYVGERQLKSTTIDLLSSRGAIGQASFVNIDVESTELDVLRGGDRYLEHVQALYVEVSRDEVRIGCARSDEVTAWLDERGFMLRRMMMTPHGWGDALYTRS